MFSSSRAYHGMKRILFQPFDMKKWFLLGFGAWLGQLLERKTFNLSGDSNLNFSDSNLVSGDSQSESNFESLYEMLSGWLQNHIGIVITVASLGLLIIVSLYVALVWVRSRGKFVFLDGVMRNRCLIKSPWQTFREQGNSLCLWTLGLVAVCLGLFLLIASFSGWHVWDIIQRAEWTSKNIVSIVGLGVPLLMMAVVYAYINMMLEHFIVPLMYRDRITATEAWKFFLPLHRKLFGSFVLFVLWVLLLRLCFAFMVMVIGFATCCVGFALLALPYISVVILLPIYVYFRLLGVNFMRQCGADFDFLALEGPPKPDQV